MARWRARPGRGGSRRRRRPAEAPVEGADRRAWGTVVICLAAILAGLLLFVWLFPDAGGPPAGPSHGVEGWWVFHRPPFGGPR